MTDLSLKQIGKYFGNRDHATVLYSVRTINDLKDIDPLFQDTVSKIEHKLENSLIHINYS